MGNNIAGCMTCRAYHHPREPGALGSCRYNPPIIRAWADITASTQGEPTAAWPTVREDDWCWRWPAEILETPK